MHSLALCFLNPIQQVPVYVVPLAEPAEPEQALRQQACTACHGNDFHVSGHQTAVKGFESWVEVKVLKGLTRLVHTATGG